MPESKPKTISTADLFADQMPKTAPKTVSTADIFSDGNAVLKDPDKYQTKGLLEEDPEALKYSVYKAARSVPIIGELAARAGDYVVGAFDQDRTADEVRAGREAKEMNFDQQNQRLSNIASVGGAMINPIKIPGFNIPGMGSATGKLPAAAKAVAQAGGVATREAAIAGTDAAVRGLDAEDPAEMAAKVAGGVSLAGKALPALGRGIAKFGLGVADPDSIAAKYSARKGFINAADEENLVDQVVGTSDEFRARNAKADEFTDMARKEYLAAKEALRADLKGTRPPETLAKEVIGSVDALSAKVSEASDKAFDILAKSDVEIPLPKIKSFLTGRMNRYKFNNTTFPGAQADIAELQQWRNYFDEIGGKTARPEEIKGLIQYLDRKTAPIYGKRAAERTLAERDILDFRKFMDSFLKEDVPGYADAMKPLAKDANLLSQARKLFDGELRADRTLERIGKPFKEKELQVLKDLSESTGKDLVSPMQEYMSAQRSMSGPAFSQRSEQLPEFGQMKQIEGAKDQLQEQTKFAKRFTREGTQSQLKRLRSVTQDPIMLRRDLEELSQQSGIDFVQLNDDLAVKEAFGKGFQNGSRNVNLGAISMQGAASLLFKTSKEIPVIGGIIGAIGGSVVDRAGPRVFQAYLDLAQSPIYQKPVGLIIEAARRSPQAAAQIQKQIMAEDPEFKAAVVSHIEGQMASEKDKTKKQGFQVPEQKQVGFQIPGR